MHHVPDAIKTKIDAIRQQPRPWRFLLSRLLWRSGICRLVKIDVGDYRLFFFPSAMSAEYWIDPHSRDGDELFLRRYLRAGNVYIDVGANIGALAIAAAITVGRSGRVFAFEPHPKVFRYLQGNTKLNALTNIALVNVAIGASGGAIRFSDHHNDDQNAIVDKAGIEVPISTLDKELEPLTAPIDLLKIDVEGYEKYVLLGAQRALTRTECIYFESSEEQFVNYGYTGAEVYNLLREHGFDLYKPMNRQKLILPLSAHYKSAHCENLLATRSIETVLQRTGYTLLEP